jgi:hypothetical protein
LADNKIQIQKTHKLIRKFLSFFFQKKKNWMGTLTSSSFSTVNLKLCSDLIGKDFRDRTKLKKWKKQSALCFSYKGGISKREVCNFSKIRCFSVNNNNNNHHHDSEKDVVDNGSDSENGDKYSNVKAALSEEKEERSSTEFGSDKAQASVSSRVLFFSFAFFG